MARQGTNSALAAPTVLQTLAVSCPSYQLHETEHGAQFLWQGQEGIKDLLSVGGSLQAGEWSVLELGLGARLLQVAQLRLRLPDAVCCGVHSLHTHAFNTLAGFM